MVDEFDTVGAMTKTLLLQTTVVVEVGKTEAITGPNFVRDEIRVLVV